MDCVGIVAEFHPLHNGHAHLLRSARQSLPDAPIVVAMSGNFVQRGDFALLEKYTRAEMAVRCGADLVVELPPYAALCSAEGFAAGAIKLLLSLGCTHLAFGAETPKPTLLQRAADLLSGLPDYIDCKGLSYAASMQAALAKVDAEAAALLDLPNNTLAIEYLRAAGGRMQPLVIARQGAGHHDTKASTDGFASASHIRSLLLQGQIHEAAHLMPPAAFALWQREVQNHRAPVRLPARELLWMLRRVAQQRSLAPDSKDGYAERLHKAVDGAGDFWQAVALAQTRRYPAARIRRTLLCAALGIEQGKTVDFIHVLALSARGRAVLRQTDLPVVQRARDLASKAADWGFADSLYWLAMPEGHSDEGLRRGTVYIE